MITRWSNALAILKIAGLLLISRGLKANSVTNDFFTSSVGGGLSFYISILMNIDLSKVCYIYLRKCNKASFSGP